MTLGIITFIFGAIAVALNIATMCITAAVAADLEMEYHTMRSSVWQEEGSE